MGVILLAAAAVIVLDYFISKEFEHIAEAKGFYRRRWFWWSFFLGVVGWLMVIALPDHGGVVTEKPVTKDEIPDI